MVYTYSLLLVFVLLLLNCEYKEKLEYESG